VPQLILVMMFSVIALFANIPTASADVGVGEVVFARGDAWVEKDDEQTAAYRGRSVYKNDIVVTGLNGRVKLIMADGSKVYVGAKSRISLQKYAMRGRNLFQASFDMFWGKARFFVNKLTSKDSSFDVRTSTAVLGVRGTEFVVTVPPPRRIPKIGSAELKNLFHPGRRVETKMSVFSGAVSALSVQNPKVTKIVTPGKTVSVDATGRMEITKTTEVDIDEKLALPTEPKDGGKGDDKKGSGKKDDVEKQGPNDGKGKKEEGGKPEAPVEETPPPPPPPPPVVGGDSGAGKNIEGTEGESPPPPPNKIDDPVFKNAIQNLGSSTDVKIKPEFVTP